MSDYIKISFIGVTHEQKDLLVAHLSEMGFEGFEEGQTWLICYSSNENYNGEALRQLAELYSLRFEKEIIEKQNWNELWEKSFQPVLVDDFCSIRASFHPEEKNTRFNIVITPKMSFGTGHHGTTYMMIKWMKDLDHKEKSVLDFGTGTGVLAILAEKLGASKIEAIDNDDWSIENANENILCNACTRIQLQKADSLDFTGQFDIILANINKNVLLANMEILQQHLAKEGVLIISGLLEGDRPAIEKEANKCKLAVKGQMINNGWISLKLAHY